MPRRLEAIIAGNQKEESKHAFFLRLRADGRWLEFKEVRLRIQAELKCSEDEAFAVASSYFPAGKPTRKHPYPDIKEKVEKEVAENPPQLNSGFTDIQVDALARNKGDSDWDSDLEWAFENIGNMLVKIKDAPSSSAWYFLDYGRDKAPVKFMDICAKHYAEKKKKSNDKQAFEDDHRRQFAILDELEKQLISENL